MKKVLFFLESLAGGGAEKVLSDIVTNIDKSVFDVTVCTVTDKGIYQKKVEDQVHYRSLLSLDSLKRGNLCRLLYKIKLKLIYNLSPQIVYRYYFKEKYDVECAFIEGFATRIIAASNNRKSKKLAWVHTDMLKNPYAQSYYKKHNQHCEVYRSFDSICCVSNSVKEVFESMFFDDKKVIVQYNPVDSNEVLEKGGEPIELIPNESLQLGTIGRLEPQKGFIRLLESVGKLLQEGFNFSLWIAGEGSQRSQLEAIIQKYHMGNNVSLLGFQSNPYKYLSKCDVFVCSSYAEGFSTAATEALILHKPIFTTECAGMSELFGDKKCGEIVENTDQALFDMLRRLVSGSIHLNDYMEDVSFRAEDFDIKIRMEEIEKLLETEK